MIKVASGIFVKKAKLKKAYEGDVAADMRLQMEEDPEHQKQVAEFNRSQATRKAQQAARTPAVEQAATAARATNKAKGIGRRPPVLGAGAARGASTAAKGWGTTALEWGKNLIKKIR